MLSFRTIFIAIVATGLAACDLDTTESDRHFDADVVPGTVRMEGTIPVLPVTTENTGSDVLTIRMPCAFGLERRSGDSWVEVAPEACNLGVGPIEALAPGEELERGIGITDEIRQDQSSEYRVSVWLRDQDGKSLSKDIGLSEPFHIK